MGRQLFSIGGMTLALEGGESLLRALSLPGLGRFSVPSGTAEATVCLDAAVRPDTFSLLHRFDIVDGTRECRFGVDAEGTYYYSFDADQWLCWDSRRADVVGMSAMADPSVLRFALWTAYSMLGLVRHRLPVHSSTVVCDGRAVMCLGESGTGKSTHTRLWLQHIGGTHLLNDDSPILAVQPDGVFVHGSPWSGKTHCYRQERVPVAALLRLEQKPGNSIRRLGVLESFAAVQPSCPPCMAKDERLMDLLVEFVSKVIQCTPVYRMGCLPDADAARLSHKTVMA